MTISLSIALAVFLVSLWRPRLGVAGLILLWPAYLLRTTIAGVPTTALELAIYAVGLATIVDILRRRDRWAWPRLPKACWWLIGLWSLAWITATAFSPDRQTSLGALKAWWFDVALFGALFLSATRALGDKLFIVKTTLVSGAVVAAAGLVQVVWFRETLQDGRLSSFFHPVANYAAMYLGPLFALGAALLFWRVLRGIVWWALIGLVALALLLTVSFAGYLAAATGLALVWWWSPPGRGKRRLGWSIIVVAITAAGVLPLTRYYGEHFRSTDRSSGLVRTQIWTTSWALIKQHPLVGIGPNAFEKSYRAEAPKHYWPPLEWLVAQPHNLYLALWLETGFLGLVVFLWGLAWWFRATWRRAGSHDIDRWLDRATIVAVAAVLVHGLFDTPYFKNDLALELTLLFVLPWIGQTGPEKKTVTEKQTTPP